jgi:beta-phosphoglucomutase-like phosphatase (HAD superfamily)
MFEVKTSKHKELFSLFDAIVTGDDVQNGKPAPDIFLLAGEKIQATPESTLVFEDATFGVSAALAANMVVVAIPDPNLDQKIYQNAHLILNSMADFQPQQ